MDGSFYRPDDGRRAERGREGGGPPAAEARQGPPSRSRERQVARPPERPEPRPHERPVFTGLNLGAEHVQAALDYLLGTVDQVEDAVMEVEDAERHLKVVWHEVFRLSTGRTQLDREAAAYVSPHYAEAAKRLARAKATIAGHRRREKAAEVVVSAWQSMQKTANAVRL